MSNSRSGSSGGGMFPMNSIPAIPSGMYLDAEGNLRPLRSRTPAPAPRATPAPTPTPRAAPTPTPTRAPRAAPEREDTRGFLGRAFDALMGSEPEAPRRYTQQELAARQREIEGRREALLRRAAENDRRAQALSRTVTSVGGADRAIVLSNAASRAREEAAALGRELEAITRTGTAVPEAQTVREMLSAAPRMATTGLLGAAPALTELVGAGLANVNRLPVGVLGPRATLATRALQAAEVPQRLRRTGIEGQEAVRAGAEAVFGAPGEGLRYDPTAQFLADVSGGIGSLATFAVPGAAARVAGVGRGLTGAERTAAVSRAALPAQYALGTGQGAQRGSEDIRAYEQRTGERVSDPAAFAALLINAGLGATEVGVARRIFESIPVAQRGQAINAVSNTIQRATMGRLDPRSVGEAVGRTLTNIETRAAGRIGVRGAEEALQEGAVQLGTNLAARALYDEERNVFENVGYSALIGGIVGGGVRGGVEASNALGNRAAANRQAALRMAVENELANRGTTFDIFVPSQEDPTQLTRETVTASGGLDESGNLTIRRADGTIEQMAPDAFSQRLAPALGEDTTAEGVPGEQAPPERDVLAEIAQQEEATRLEREQRNEIFQQALDSPDVNKLEAFNSLMTANGFTPNAVETTAIRDWLREQSAQETAAGRAKDVARQNTQIERMNIVERVLYDDRIPMDLKIDRANTKLRKKNMKPLSARELGTVYGYETAEAVFGSRGEYQQRLDAEQAQIDAQQAEINAKRDAALQRIASNPTIKDKYRAFITQADKNGWEGPNEQEMAALRGDAAEIESQIPERAERVPAEVRQAIAARQEELLAGEPDYDADPAIAAINEEFDQRITSVIDLTRYPDLTNMVKALQGEEVITDADVKAIRGAVREADGPDKFDTARQELGSILERVRDTRVTEAVEQLNKDFVRSARAQAEAEVMAAQQAAVPEEAPSAPEPTVRRIAPMPGTVVDERVTAPVEEAPVVEAPPVEAPVEAPPAEVPAAPTPTPIAAAPTPTAVPTATAAPTPAAAAPTPAAPEVEASTADIITEEETPSTTAAEEAPTPSARITAPSIPGGSPPSPNSPRIETVGAAVDMQGRVRRMASAALRKFNFRYQPAVDYARALGSVYGVTRLPDDMNLANKFLLLESRKIGNQMSLKRWYLDPLENKIKELELDPKDVGLYLWARSARDRNAMVFERSNGEILDGSGMTDADADATIQQLAREGKLNDLKTVAKLFDNMIDYIGNQRVKAGMLSKEDWARIRKQQPFYAPLKGFALDGEDMNEDGDPRRAMAEARGEYEQRGGRTAIKEFLSPKGRETMPFNPLFTGMSDAQLSIARMERNRVGQQLLDNALADPDIHSDVVRVYSMEEAPEDVRRRATEVGQAADKVFVVKKNGQTFFLDFQNTEAGNLLYRAFSNMTPKELGAFYTGGSFTIPGTNRVIEYPGLINASNGMKSLLTRFNPGYLLGTAWQRDFQEAILTNLSAQSYEGGPGEGKKIAAQSAKYMFSSEQAAVLRAYLTGNEPDADKLLRLRTSLPGATTESVENTTVLFDQFLRDGGAVGNAMISEAADRVKDFDNALGVIKQLQQGRPAKAALEFAGLGLDFLDTISQVIDMQARFATYRAALDAGINRDNAALLALDSSLNLTRRGELAPILDAWVFFFSAGVEGGRKFVDQGMSSRNARVLILASIKLGILNHFWNLFRAGDDDEDERNNVYDINDVTRQTRSIWYYGSGTNDYLQIPVAFSFGFSKYVGEQVAAMMVGDISPMAAAVTSANAFRQMALPFRVAGSGDFITDVMTMVSPTAPLVEAERNVNPFGAPVYRVNPFSDMPRSEGGREDTPEIWKSIARAVNDMGGSTYRPGAISREPEWYEHIVARYGGGLFNFGKDVTNFFAADPREGQTLLQRIPIIKAFFGKGGEYAPMNNFYRNTADMKPLSELYSDENLGPEEWQQRWDAERREAPVLTDERVVEAYDAATDELKALRSDFRAGAYESRDAYYADTNEVYKEFNRLFNEVQREYQNR